MLTEEHKAQRQMSLTIQPSTADEVTTFLFSIFSIIMPFFIFPLCAIQSSVFYGLFKYAALKDSIREAINIFCVIISNGIIFL